MVQLVAPRGESALVRPQGTKKLDTPVLLPEIAEVPPVLLLVIPVAVVLKLLGSTVYEPVV